jgi:trk system potassium uptake protein TrkA
MKIVIVGAGAVGSYLAERLSAEGQDVTVIESDPVVAARVDTAIDCQVITGNGASARTLKEARLSEADLLIAVSSSDAVNVLACNAATKLGIDRKVARVEDPELKAEVEALGVDFVIDPGKAAARELLILVSRGGISELVDFAEGKLVLIGAYIDPSNALLGITLADLRSTVTGWDWLVVAIIRRGETMIARGTTRLEAHDHVLLMARADRTEEAYRFLGLTDTAAENAVILGGTRLARVTAELLVERGITTTLIDANPDRCREIAMAIPEVLTVCGDPTDPRVLRSEGAGKADSVLALTDWDGDNLLGCLVARALGAGEVIARFNTPELVRVLSGIGPDATVSSRLSAASEILRFVRRGAIYSVATFSDSDAEAIELEVTAKSPGIGKTLADLKLPRSLIIGGIQRGGEAFIPHGDTRIQEGDHLIVVALPESFLAAEKLSG